MSVADRYVVIDASELLNKNETLFAEFQKEHVFVKYSDLYSLIVLAFYIPPSHVLDFSDTIYNKVVHYYYYDINKLDSSTTFSLLVENIQYTIFDLIGNFWYSHFTIDQYDPDCDTIVAVRFLTPKTLLLQISRDSKCHV